MKIDERVQWLIAEHAATRSGQTHEDVVFAITRTVFFLTTGLEINKVSWGLQDWDNECDSFREAMMSMDPEMIARVLSSASCDFFSDDRVNLVSFDEFRFVKLFVEYRDELLEQIC